MTALEVKTPAGFTRRFEVEEVRTESTPVGPPRGYVLTGAKGATYSAVRFVDDPLRLHIVQWGGGRPFPGVVLTDADGVLRQVSR